MEFKFNNDGLIPAVVQDYRTGEVLMLAYMNEEAIQKTKETKTSWFYSRSRQELWNKGATSGHTQTVKKMSYDCDEDTILLQVEQKGAACHTGERSCFYRDIELGEEPTFKRDVVNQIYQSIIDRQENPKEGSYTNYLFDEGIDKILKKVGEEAGEVIIGAKNDDHENLAMEIADLTYHILVLLAEKGMPVERVKEELTKRVKGE
ncbi:bifunctional phosphoribosyl-AMP cyclohydrolase/phosphoribosyl-ATP diphosphatase HisIE [Filobacillus milosensis]|uniref:Histidine biosynthesis bifunctional protein HisIE n=1 Tax=Filobacillus milosensis TaxID=94137 RepID=A0A4Y8IN97_9BACI|nr:bifunctional phosphoribosyl-AMP cyclohydrolase/phosphoribosyl-ATP diphosphatase HisIE [Filobacillus milosensis]TFB21709.1 bifunctional phosphoribosyl-AMP cyclohydrolase/phosphoribosyl-ATP diphosphatase HisIE [Filobacillus milosensis]